MTDPRPAMTDDQFAAWNEEMATRYDPEQFYEQSGVLVRLVESRRIATVVRHVAATAGDRILEVGCGAGHILARLPAGELYGIDLADVMLARAGERLGARATLTKANAEHLPFPDGMFQKVICSEVLEHVPEPARVLAELARVLAPSGVAVVSIPNEPLINRLKHLLLKLRLFKPLLTRKDGYVPPERMDDEWHLHAFILPMLRELAQPWFRVQRVSAIPGSLLPIRYVVSFAHGTTSPAGS